jgi:hypothetical protein
LAEFFVTQGDRILFRLTDTAGELKSMVKKGEVPPPRPCAFASGESFDPKAEGIIFRAAEEAKDWDAFVFKLKLEGFELKAGPSKKLPFGKL